MLCRICDNERYGKDVRNKLWFELFVKNESH